MIRLFRVFIPTSIIALFLAETILIFGCYTLALSLVYDVDPWLFLTVEGGFIRIGTAWLGAMVGFYMLDLYSEIRVLSMAQLIQDLCLVSGCTFIGQALSSYLNRDWSLPRWVMVFGTAFMIVAILSFRLLFMRIVTTAVRSEKLLFVGASPAAFRIVDHLKNRPELGLVAIGYLDDELESIADAPCPRLGALSDLGKVASEVKPDRVIVGMKERRQRMPVSDLLNLRFTGVRTEDVAHIYELTFGCVCASEIRPSNLIFSSELGPRPRNVQIQKLYSTAIAALGLILISPVMLIVALLVRLTSPGPILHRQVRVGMHHKNFTVFKFRSMYQDAEARTGAVWATKNDPRITPLGRWLRKLRLDELPQLFNVLRGEMSIVGPRPERPEFTTALSEKIPYYPQRHSVRPGITGWAQINYKYGDTIEDTVRKLEYDLYYIKNMSPALDFYIMFHTVKTMLLLRGAQ